MRLDELGVRGVSTLVALSGGGDSTALAVAAAEARRAGRLRPWLVHVEHGVRPDAEDVPVVLATAERLGLPLSVRAIPTGAIAGHRGTGIEEAMRRERYLVLSRTARETSSRFVMTGHHADDQAETVLSHLIRGSGVDGASGILPMSTLPVPWWGDEPPGPLLTLVRPLLRERRSVLRHLVEWAHLATIDDATNLDVERTRAALRHDVLPALERISPGAAEALARFAEVARVQTSAASRPHAEEAAIHRPLDVAELRRGDIRLQRLSLRAWIREVTGVTPSFERVESVRRWATSGGSGCVEVGLGCSIRRSGGQLEFTRPDRDGGTATTWGPRTPESPGS